MRSDKLKTDPMEAAEALRNGMLARNWPSSEEVAAANGVDSLNHASWTRRLREEGKLLGVWSAQEQAYRYPTFQFLLNGALNPRAQELLRALATNDDFRTSVDTGGWRRAFWLYGATLLVTGPDGNPQVPAEVFAQDPESVINAAQQASDSGPW
jgi:hypothetical protein